MNRRSKRLRKKLRVSANRHVDVASACQNSKGTMGCKISSTIVPILCHFLLVDLRFDVERRGKRVMPYHTEQEPGRLPVERLVATSKRFLGGIVSRGAIRIYSFDSYVRNELNLEH
jgi:hypothetical protein